MKIKPAKNLIPKRVRPLKYPKLIEAAKGLKLGHSIDLVFTDKEIKEATVEVRAARIAQALRSNLPDRATKLSVFSFPEENKLTVAYHNRKVRPPVKKVKSKKKTTKKASRSRKKTTKKK